MHMKHLVLVALYVFKFRGNVFGSLLNWVHFLLIVRGVETRWEDGSSHTPAHTWVIFR